MSKILKRACIALALLLSTATGAEVLVASPASARADWDACEQTSSSDGDMNFDFETCASATSDVKVKSHASGKARVDSRGRLILSFIMPGGIPDSQQNQCKTIPAGKSYVNNYYDSTGAERWVKKTAPAGGVKICVMPDGKWHVVKCGNVVLMKPPPRIKKQIFHGKFVVRKRQKIWSEAIAKANGTSHSAVHATNTNCPDSFAEATADGSFTAIARARAWGWTKRSSLMTLNGQIRELHIEESVRDSARANAMADARGKAQTNVEAKVVCSGPGEQPTPKPNMIEIETVNDVLVNNSRTIGMSGSVAPNHTATLTCTAKNGGSITAGRTQTVQGNFTTSITYLAPSEVPGANGDIAAGRDRVDCTLTQDDGQSDSISTNQFLIVKPKPDPQKSA